MTVSMSVLVCRVGVIGDSMMMMMMLRAGVPCHIRNWEVLDRIVTGHVCQSQDSAPTFLDVAVTASVLGAAASDLRVCDVLGS